MQLKSPFRETHGLNPDVLEDDIEIPIRDGSVILARVYYPAERITINDSLPLFIFFHGGGFCIGSRYDDFESNRAVALRNKAVVVSPEYRLAPENYFPTAVHDGLDTLQWVAAKAHKIHPSTSSFAGLIVGSTSSGGNIASAVIYLNRDQEHPVKVTGQFLSVAPLLPAPVVPEKYRRDCSSAEEANEFSFPSQDLIQLFLDESLFNHSFYPRPHLVLRIASTSKINHNSVTPH
ncbi:hypothetical protein N7462_000200 [Penicillium macrosclerotiorum]|uniref:uncharacterized protein n=1 Tax=Penicillium macrosclerotiorum TaxID=303699 RepID=UPI0025493687|nr:uncharacterized protein N7462_000200 [Penicillium macrosclerotiorum]KAJ5698195.1 hypothetical protein N7462_000200 [Penicillium macrosclerotiorum]